VTINPASFWLGFSAAFIVMGVLAIAIAGLCARRGEISGSIGSIRPRHYSELDEHDKPRFV
jgi:hypothetical protein